MKQTILIGSILVALFALGSIVSPVMACQNGQDQNGQNMPSNRNGLDKYSWHLSGAVMPVPPYGSQDIVGSDTASKLMVLDRLHDSDQCRDHDGRGQCRDKHFTDKGQCFGWDERGKCKDIEATIMGDMKGLIPNTVYTVYLSNSYTPYAFAGWSVIGTWALQWVVNGGTYDHDVIIAIQSGGIFSGTAYYPAGCGDTSVSCTYTEPVTGTIGAPTSGSVTIHLTQSGGYYSDSIGTIAQDGTISGTWTDSIGNSGTFSTLSGAATPLTSGSTGWSGLFTNTVPPFTFTTDKHGSGTWHAPLCATSFPNLGTYTLSVWINQAGATVLISDNFTIVV